MTFLKNSKEASAGWREKGAKERRAENKVSEASSSQSLIGHYKEFAFYSPCGGSNCVFCMGKRHGIIDHCGCSGENRLWEQEEKLKDCLVLLGLL